MECFFCIIVYVGSRERNNDKKIIRGSLVKRSRHHPFTVVTGVRFPYESPLWAHSSAGRASALQAEGHRFDPCCAHHSVLTLNYIVAQWLSWLECRPVTPEVEGSSPFWVAIICWHGSTVEQLTCNQQVVGSIPIASSNLIWLIGQAVKTPPFHGGNRGSIPL